MKTPDEIKKGMYCCYGDPYGRECDECPYDFIDEKYCDCYLGADVREYIQQLEAAQPKWISVEERLPDVGEKVMICGVKNGMQVGAFRGLSHPGENRKWWWKKNTVIEVTHWMSMSEPLKEE